MSNTLDAMAEGNQGSGSELGSGNTGSESGEGNPGSGSGSGSLYKPHFLYLRFTIFSLFSTMISKMLCLLLVSKKYH